MRYGLLCALIAPSIMTIQAQTPTPPTAPAHEHREVRHGATVIDPYFWLREKSNPEVVKYLEEENAYTEAMTANLKPFEDTLYNEMLGRIKQTDLAVPVRRGEYLYYTRTEEGKQYPIQCRRKGSHGSARSRSCWTRTRWARRTSSSGSGAVALQRRRQPAGVHRRFHRLPPVRPPGEGSAHGRDAAGHHERVTSVEWAADNKTLFLVTEDAVTKRSDKLWRHVLGRLRSSRSTRRRTNSTTSAWARPATSSTWCSGWRRKDTTEWRYLRADQPAGAASRRSLPREKDHRYYIDHREGLFYIRTNRDGVNSRVVTAPETDPGREELEGLAAASQGRAAQRYRSVPRFRGQRGEDRGGEPAPHLQLRQEGVDRDCVPGEGVLGVPRRHAGIRRRPPTATATRASSRLRASTTTTSRRGKSTLLKRQEVLGGYDPSQYASERLWATARDGTKVPVSIVYKKGFARDGKGPLFLYAYGSYGFGTPVTFSSSRFSLLDRGMAYAIAHIRGGDEMGWQWRLDGMLMKKKNTFFDFVDCAEYLIKEKWTVKDRLVIEGGSAGGLLMGAVVNLRPGPVPRGARWRCRSWT